MKNFLLCSTLFMLSFFVFENTSIAQEQAPIKKFEYSISLNQLKTESQAKEILNEVRVLPQIQNCQLEFTSYLLIFQCTNHAILEHQLMDRIKAIVVSHGAEIVKIDRKEL